MFLDLHYDNRRNGWNLLVYSVHAGCGSFFTRVRFEIFFFLFNLTLVHKIAICRGYEISKKYLEYESVLAPLDEVIGLEKENTLKGDDTEETETLTNLNPNEKM